MGLQLRGVLEPEQDLGVSLSPAFHSHPSQDLRAGLLRRHMLEAWSIHLPECPVSVHSKEGRGDRGVGMWSGMPI